MSSGTDTNALFFSISYAIVVFFFYKQDDATVDEDDDQEEKRRDAGDGVPGFRAAGAARDVEVAGRDDEMGMDHETAEDEDYGTEREEDEEVDDEEEEDDDVDEGEIDDNNQILSEVGRSY